MLSPFSQTLYSTVLNEKSSNLLPFFFRRAASNYCSTASTNLGFFVILLCYSTVHKIADFNFVVFEFNVPRTNSNIKPARY